ncbi:MAG: hypothetical protein AB7G93_09230 [Bdellovibrionales bacterium]
MRRPLVLIATAVILVFGASSGAAWAYEPGGFFLDPRVAVGFNTSQGTHFIAGLDVGLGLSETLAAGVGGYYSAGERPQHDREYGVGPFLSYVQPLTSFLLAAVRQELNHVNLRDPVKVTEADGSTSYTHNEEDGLASVTTVGLHLFFTPNMGLSAGYRFVLGLSNPDLDDGRSGTFIGLSIGI